VAGQYDEKGDLEGGGGEVRANGVVVVGTMMPAVVCDGRMVGWMWLWRWLQWLLMWWKMGSNIQQRRGQ
jgi:hypothetical protein